MSRPQGDARRVDNYVRCVTDSNTSANTNGNPSAITASGETVSGETDSQPPTDNQERPQIDFASVAAQLGVTEEALIAALGLQAGGPPTNQP